MSMNSFPPLNDLSQEQPPPQRAPLSFFARAAIISICVFALIGACVAYTANLYNNLLTRDELVDAAWSDVINMYRRRADLLPGVIEAVQAYATHERELLVELSNSRTRLLAGLPSAGPDPSAFARLGQEQQAMTRSIGRLIALVERYPELKADTLFQGLIVELAGSENRISFARSRFIESVKDYNLAVRHFPGNLLAQHFGFKVRPKFDDAAALNQAPPRMQAQ